MSRQTLASVDIPWPVRPPDPSEIPFEYSQEVSLEFIVDDRAPRVENVARTNRITVGRQKYPCPAPRCGGFLPGHSNPRMMSEGPAVGIVGPADAAVERAVREAGGRPVPGAAAEVTADTDFVVAVGEPGLLAVARAGPDVPVVPVDAGRGVRSVPGEAEAVGSAIAALLADEYTCEDHPILEARVGDRTSALALEDVMLASAEPAQISEYTVRAGCERVARFRADGVVIATPAGSPGYARAAGGPVVPPGAGVLPVVPVSPFSTDVDHWVLPLGDVTVSVERDETDIHLVADDRVVGLVDPADPAEISPASTLSVAVLDASRSCFDRA
jgi:NAD+ kinase